MRIAEHHIRHNVSNSDQIGVGSGAQKCHGTTGTECLLSISFGEETDVALSAAATRRAAVTCVGAHSDQRSDAKAVDGRERCADSSGGEL
jgi:hypothetical protein